MRRTLLLVAFLVSCLVACGPSRRPGPPWAYETVFVQPCANPGTDLASLSPDYPSGGATLTAKCGWEVVVPADVAADSSRCALVLGAVDQWKADFESYFQVTAPDTRIVVFDKPFSLSDGSTNRYGLWPGIENPDYQDVVLIWLGNHDDLPWLFHELVHRVLHVTHDAQVDEPWWIEWNTVDEKFDEPLASR